MAGSSAERSSIVEQLLKKPSPQHEPEVEEAIDSYQEGRSRSRPSLMLDLRLLTEPSRAFRIATSRASGFRRITPLPCDSARMRCGLWDGICTVSSRRSQSNGQDSFRKVRMAKRV
jgi:hypothetical protein